MIKVCEMKVSSSENILIYSAAEPFDRDIGDISIQKISAGTDSDASRDDAVRDVFSRISLAD
jgi:hypothetical protein